MENILNDAEAEKEKTVSKNTICMDICILQLQDRYTDQAAYTSITPNLSRRKLGKRWSRHWQSPHIKLSGPDRQDGRAEARQKAVSMEHLSAQIQDLYTLWGAFDGSPSSSFFPSGEEGSI